MFNNKTVPALVLSAILFTGCNDKGTETTPDTPSNTIDLNQSVEVAPVDNARYFDEITWTPINGSTADSGEENSFTLNGGSVFGIFFGSGIEAGETAKLTLDIKSSTPTSLKIYLVRHCDVTNGEDFEVQDVEVQTEWSSFEINKTFENAYSCLRMTIVGAGEDNPSISVNNANLGITPK